MENSALRSSSLGTWAKPLAWPNPQTSGCRCPTRGTSRTPTHVHKPEDKRPRKPEHAAQ